MITAFEQAKELHAAGELPQAEALYREAAASGIESFKAYNNLGTLLEEQGRIDEAVEAYLAGITLAPECFLLHYNLGHALHRARRLNEAFMAYVHAVQLEPDSFETHYNLANLLSEQGRYESAIAAYRRALALHESKEIYSNLGTALFEEKNMEEAAACYRKAIELDPDAPSEHFRLGRTLDALAQFDEAIGCYERSLQLNPSSSATHAHLIMVLQNLQRDHEVELAFSAWKQAIPEDPVAEHMWASYAQENVPTRAADGYIHAVFDAAASDYDAVVSRLNYRGPQLLASQLDNLRTRPGANLRILDAGCGTGLCGPLLRPLASELSGVDLSIGMLEKASLRGCYDDLWQQELTDCLSHQSARFEAIVAADTFIYFGDLRDVFAAAYGALTQRGLLLFTVEAIREEGTKAYTIGHHGRYAHAFEFIDLTLQHAGFEILSSDFETLRREAAADVKAHVFVARKLDSP